MNAKEAPAESGAITPAALAGKLGGNCDGVLLDVRTPGEYKGGHIPGARMMPLGDLDAAGFLQREGAGRIYVICQSGSRARKAIEAFERAGHRGCVLLEGGMEGWTRAGLPTVKEAGAGLPIMRQVQIVVGAASLAGSVLALLADPLFAIIPLVTGCGLLVTGLSGWCGLGSMLAKMPWNRLGTDCAGGRCSAGGRVCS